MPAPIAVIVPTYNRASLLEQLLHSLERQTLSHDVVVVDNGSTDETASLVEQRFPEVRLVSLPQNLGFGRAINAGVRASRAETLVFLNNDVVCEPDFIERLVGALEPRAGVVMAAGVLLQAARPDRIDTAGIEFDRSLLAFDYLHGAPVSVLDDGLRDPVGPCAGAAAFERGAFESVGGFDESFFAYLEDVDLVIRLMAAGGRCRLAPGARALHRHSATLGARSRKKNELIGWSRGYMIGKYRLHRHPSVLVRALVAEATGALGKMLLDRSGAALRPRLAGWRAGLHTEAHELPVTPADVPTIRFLEAQRRRIQRRIPA